MLPARQGSFRLFSFLGIDVYLHWSWFIIACFQIQNPINHYSTIVWNVWEYIFLFVIVLLHEFGHALACRQVGGQAEQIVLWPLGGVAYVAPPQRPGATLWSIAAGPLVNVLLVPVFTSLRWLSETHGWANTEPNVDSFFLNLWRINLGLLIFNMLPIYPLDGGQILRSLLWFPFGKIRSLLIATVLGFLGALALIPFIIKAQGVWLYVILAFIFLNCWRGFQQARLMARLEKAPRRFDFACPVCKASPRIGVFWLCAKCRQPFDTFATHAQCPHCQTQYEVTACQECGSARPMNDWAANVVDLPPKI